MVTLKIVGIEKSKYLLIDEKNNVLSSMYFEFYGLENPKINDTISFNEALIDKNYEGYAQPYAFELVKNLNEYNKKKKIDYAVLNVNGKELLLRRIYG